MDHLQYKLQRLLLLELSWGKHPGDEIDKNQASSAWLAPSQWKNDSI